MGKLDRILQTMIRKCTSGAVINFSYGTLQCVKGTEDQIYEHFNK